MKKFEMLVKDYETGNYAPTGDVMESDTEEFAVDMYEEYFTAHYGMNISENEILAIEIIEDKCPMFEIQLEWHFMDIEKVYTFANVKDFYLYNNFYYVVRDTGRVKFDVDTVKVLSVKPQAGKQTGKTIHIW